MKTLILMRHAKSCAKTVGQSDYDRPLDARGRGDAPQMAQRLRDAGLSPNAVFASGARRVRETWESMAPEFLEQTPITFTDRLYLAAPRDLVEIAATTASQAGRLMILGHNPGLASWIARLTGTGEAFPTAATALIELAIDQWSELRETSTGRLAALWTPQDDD